MAAAVADPILGVLNKAWGSVTVTTGYSFVYSIGADSFHVQSEEGGHLTVTPLQQHEVKAVLASTATHVVLEDGATAYEALLGDGLQTALDQRRFRIEGDGSQLRALVKEMQSSSTEVQAEVDAMTSRMGLPGLSSVQKPEKPSLHDRVMLPDGVTSVAIRVDQAEADPVTRCLRLWDSLYFSTFTTMGGNVGQGPYNPANGCLDSLAKTARQTYFRPYAATLMWGGVAGVGMRWKAFGSQDAMILSGQTEMMISVEEAGTILRTLLTRVQDVPDWMAASPLDEQARAYYGLTGTPPAGEGPALAEAYKWTWDPKLENFVWKVSSQVDQVGEKHVEYESEDQQCRKLRSARERWLASRKGDSAQLEEEALNGYDTTIREVEQWALKHAWHFDMCREARREMAAIVECPFIIGGTWDGWQAHDLSTWNSTEECYTLEIGVGQRGTEQFQVQPGRCKRGHHNASFPTFLRKWTLSGSPGDKFKVKVFVALDGTLDHVDTQPQGPVSQHAVEYRPAPSGLEVGDKGGAGRSKDASVQLSSIGLDKAFYHAFPGMKEKARMSAVDKLAHAEIFTLLDLCWSLDSTGSEGLDVKLQNLGEKDFAIRSMRKLCEEVRKHVSPADAVETAAGAAAVPVVHRGPVVVKNLTRGGSVAVDVPQDATILQVRKAVMLKLGEINPAKVKIVEKVGTATKMIADAEPLGTRQELWMVGRPL
mmetsp:Transcript_53863/g.99551  ORF Transcript_53863/g.99551 Transcript_53863/m.99551 type:complete len:709 (+) Transcript_53863:74-2200(+)